MPGSDFVAQKQSKREKREPLENHVLIHHIVGSHSLPYMSTQEIEDNFDGDLGRISKWEEKRYVKNDKKTEQVIIPIGDGLTVCRKL